VPFKRYWDYIYGDCKVVSFSHSCNCEYQNILLSFTKLVRTKVVTHLFSRDLFLSFCSTKGTLSDSASRSCGATCGVDLMKEWIFSRIDVPGHALSQQRLRHAHAMLCTLAQSGTTHGA